MNKDFLITGIRRIVLVGKGEYTEKETSFPNDLTANELIYHTEGESTVYFNGKVMEISPDCIRFLPKGETKEYLVRRKKPGECIDVVFDTDIPISFDAFVMNAKNNTKIKPLFKKKFFSMGFKK